MVSRPAAAFDALEDALRRSERMRTWLRSRRWCGEALGMRTEISIKDRAVLGEGQGEILVVFLAVARETEGAVPMHLPLSLSTARTDGDAFDLAVGDMHWYVTEGERREAYARFLVDGLRRRGQTRTATGDALLFRGEFEGSYRELVPTAATDTSNVVVRIATSRQAIVFKSYKLLDTHNREPVILERLHRRRFPHVPGFVGDLALGRGSDRIVLGVATEYVDAEDAFTWLTSGWRDELAQVRAGEGGAFEKASLDTSAALGEATARLHEALLDRHPGPFQAETFQAEDVSAARKDAISNLSDSLRRLSLLSKGAADADRASLASHARELLLDHRRDIEEALTGLESGIGTPKSVIHADLHLAQVLRRKSDGALFFIDFEGEPERAPGTRSDKMPPLRDVATMNRSLSYVVQYVWREATGGAGRAALNLREADQLSADERSLAHRLLSWESDSVQRLSDQYLGRSDVYRDLSREDVRKAIRGWMMEKALYELRYELKHRPENVPIPLEGVLSLAGEENGRGPPAP